MDGNNETYDDLFKKRKAEEQRLINELRRKRACVRLAPALPSEDDVQTKIKQFVRSVLYVTKSNQLQDVAAELFAQKPHFFARREAALYKCKVENLRMTVQGIIEKIRGAAEAVSMSYDTYELLILAKTAAEESRAKFFNEDVD
ncbi:unnamed protein product [Nippostrongylus brasiliensis]|uniref:Uncharacterized protein n=1 Tax=Nippostrongylus brasiliensis TaxID=27835 RepID=A0A0N4YDX3_NIPBR|nr:unnamed protein product [Nippostrongylus brasiliensis]